MNKVVIYHNPRCSKSRETLELLRDQDIEPEIIEYLNTPPDFNTIEHIASLLGGARKLIRKSENLYQELKLDDETLDDKTLIQAMSDNPILIERPVVLANNKAAIGRPPEDVLPILKQGD